MKSRRLLTILAPLALLAMAESAAAATLVVTKTAYCGCCKHWVEHMKKAGFQVEVREVEDVAPGDEIAKFPEHHSLPLSADRP